MNEELKQQMLKDLEQFRSKNTPQKSSIQADLENFRKSKITPQTPEQIHIQGLKESRDESNLDFERKQELLRSKGPLGRASAFVMDLGRGVENQAQKQGGNLLTFGASFAKGAGIVNEEDIPVWLRSGNKANEFATGKAYEGQNLTQKAGAFGFGAASALAPTPFGKVGLTGRAGTFAKALTEGAQGDVMLSGDVSPLTLGLASLSGARSLVSSVKTEKELLSKAHEKFAQGDIEGGQKILANPALIDFQRKLGLDTPEGVKLNQQREIAQVDDLLAESKSEASSQVDLINSLSPESKILFLQFAAPEITKMKGKTGLRGTYNALEKAKEEVWDKLDKLTRFLSNNRILKGVEYETGRGSEFDVLIKDAIRRSGGDQLQRNAIQSEVDNILNAYYNENKKIGKMNFQDLNEIRKTANKDTSKPYLDDAYHVIADAFRNRLDLEIEDLGKNINLLNDAGKAKQEAFSLFKTLNRQYGELKDAQRITDQVSKVKPNSNSRFQEMIGGIIATGGTYNPVAYLVGSEATKRLGKVFQDMNNAEFGVGAKFMRQISDNEWTSELLNEFLKKAKKPVDVMDKLRKRRGIK